MTGTKKFILELIGALVFFVSLILIHRYTNLDLIVSDKAHSLTGFETTALLAAAAWIGKYLSIIACGAFLLYLPFLIKKKNPLAKEACLAICILVIGSGLVNNFFLKPFFKRPRPVQIERYTENASAKFVPALSRGKIDSHTSFPSGHSGAAFFFIFPWFCLRFREKYGIRLIIPGLIFGVITGSVRILEGRHFPTDVLASLMVVYLTGTILSYFFYKKSKMTEAQKASL